SVSGPLVQRPARRPAGGAAGRRPGATAGGWAGAVSPGRQTLRPVCGGRGRYAHRRGQRHRQGSAADFDRAALLVWRNLIVRWSAAHPRCLCRRRYYFAAGTTGTAAGTARTTAAVLARL